MPCDGRIYRDDLSIADGRVKVEVGLDPNDVTNKDIVEALKTVALMGDLIDQYGIGIVLETPKGESGAARDAERVGLDIWLIETSG